MIYLQQCDVFTTENTAAKTAKSAKGLKAVNVVYLQFRIILNFIGDKFLF